MTPSQTIVIEANQTLTVVDKAGRRLLLRRLTALDMLRLFKAAGPVLAQNEPWLSMASLALSVLEIDGVPVPAPANEGQIEKLIGLLSDVGLEAIAEALKHEQEPPEVKQNVGNLPGIPS